MLVGSFLLCGALLRDLLFLVRFGCMGCAMGCGIQRTRTLFRPGVDEVGRRRTKTAGTLSLLVQTVNNEHIGWCKTNSLARELAQSVSSELAQSGSSELAQSVSSELVQSLPKLMAQFNLQFDL